MDDAFELITSRRSTRKFSAKPVDRKLLDRVLEAGRYAPSGGNSQTSHLIVITNREVLEQMAVIARESFAKMEVLPSTYRSLASAIKASKSGNYVFHYNAPVLVVVANKKGYGNALADTGCLIENMMLEANSLDLGSCWINQVHWLDEDPDMHAKMVELGLREDERITGGMALGYADSEDELPERRPLPRTGNQITYVE